jgi:hypothetical protein
MYFFDFWGTVFSTMSTINLSSSPKLCVKLDDEHDDMNPTDIEPFIRKKSSSFSGSDATFIHNIDKLGQHSSKKQTKWGNFKFALGTSLVMLLVTYTVWCRTKCTEVKGSRNSKVELSPNDLSAINNTSDPFGVCIAF